MISSTHARSRAFDTSHDPRAAGCPAGNADIIGILTVLDRGSNVIGTSLTNLPWLERLGI